MRITLNGASGGKADGRDNVATKLGSLTLSDGSPASPRPDTCLAHLRLLHAFDKLKQSIGYQDGLWNIWDNRASASGNHIDVLSELREKRWAVFLARAVDRYGEWWQSLGPSMLKESQMMEENGERYERFVQGRPLAWTRNDLPPLDVLLVWHAHMLSPRLYLEDCIRYGYSGLWAAGMPWHIINETVDPDFDYEVEEDCQETWQRRTGCEWENALDPLHKIVSCPSCSTKLHIPWTTCGLPHDYTVEESPGLAGDGYGDGWLSFTCGKCRFNVTEEVLRVDKFRNVMKAYMEHGIAVPGTILDIDTGLPRRLVDKNDDRLFPSLLFNKSVFDDVDDEFELENANAHPSMAMVHTLLDKVFNKAEAASTDGKPRISGASKIYAVRMLSRYTQNSSFASLDLVGAVMRLGVFTDNMKELDWLHIKSATTMMQRHLAKYVRFMQVVQKKASQFPAVPTLDVDLAWHTHLLSPKDYFGSTVNEMGMLPDHHDKIDEDILSWFFAWTCMEYWNMFDVPYSDCTCWYCESIRYLDDPEGADEWHRHGDAAVHPQPPHSPSAHLSAHAAVQVKKTPCEFKKMFEKRAQHQNDVAKAHTDAMQAAAKAQNPRRMGPEVEKFFDFWGKDIHTSDWPTVSSLAVQCTREMYASHPGIVEHGSGAIGFSCEKQCDGW